MKCDQICNWNSNVGCVKPYGVPCILENVSPTDKKATNADRIRAMSDEELAKVLNAFTAYFDECNRSADEIDCKDCELCKLCALWDGKAMEWLKQPADPQKGE